MSIKNVNKEQTFKCSVMGYMRCKPKTYCTKEVVDKKTGEVKTVHDGKTKQEFKEETDVNVIVRRFNKGMPITHIAKAPPVFADATRFGDFESNMNRIAVAKEAFASIPAKIRKRFNNSVSDLMEFLQDPNNRDEAIKLGLVEKPKEPPKEPAPQKVVIVTDPTVPTPPKA